MKQKDFKLGFIITYFDSNEQSEETLRSLAKTMSKEDYFLVLSSHSPVSKDIQDMFDEVVFEKLNPVDERQYSHGIAELSLIKKALVLLNNVGIDYTYKVAYDIDVINPSRFKNWIKDYAYGYVSCLWGDNDISTHSFFASVGFMLDKMPFYDDFDEMVQISNVVEMAWRIEMNQKGLKDKIFLFKNVEEMYGENVFNIFYYNYDSLDFSYNPNETKFYITSNASDLKGGLGIYDYYTDVCVAYYHNFDLNKGIQYWILPPAPFYLNSAKNGFYIKYYKDNGRVIRRNILIKDYSYKHPLAKRFATIDYKECKFNEYCDFENLYIYKDLGINIESIKRYLDVGANFGFSAYEFMMRDCEVYMVEADPRNVEILEKTFGSMNNVHLIPKAVYNTNEDITFYLDNAISVISSVDSNYGSGNRTKVTVPSITPDSLMEGIGEIDLMKIDIEGAEYVFFDNISKQNLRKIKSMIIEYHLNKNFEIKSIIKKLSQCGYDYKFIPWGDFLNPLFMKNEQGVIYAERLH